MCSDSKLREVAEEFEGKNDWANALKIWEKLNDRYPDDVNVLLKVGWCQSLLKRYDDSIGTFHKAVNMEPKNAICHYMMGYQYYGLHQWNKAIVWFENAIRLRPNYMKATYRLGYALLASCGQRYQMKNANFHKALERFKECGDIWDMLDENERRQLSSEYGKACHQLGKMYLMMDKQEEAIAYFRRADEVKPTPDTKYQLAKALKETGRSNEALKILTKEQQKEYMRKLQAELLMDIGEIDKGLDILLSLVKKDRVDYILREISEAYILKEDLNSAYSYIIQAIICNNNNHKNHLVLSKVYRKARLLYAAKDEVYKACSIYMDRYKADYGGGKALLNSINQEILKIGHGQDNEQILEDLKKAGINKYSPKRTGVIDKFYKDRGFGFIKDRGESIFFHITKVLQRQHVNVKEGLKVSFSSEVTDKGMAATEVLILDD